MDITYCYHVDCIHKDCIRHLDNAPKDVDISIADLNDGLCFDFIEEPTKRERLLATICKGTQKTNYKCDVACRALCGNDGTCAHCSIIADAIEEEFK
jgi:hypothetical protein